MLLVVIAATLANCLGVGAYKNLFTVARFNDIVEVTTCTVKKTTNISMLIQKKVLKKVDTTGAEKDPYNAIEGIIDTFLFGNNTETTTEFQKYEQKLHGLDDDETDLMVYPTGSIHHADVFDSHAGVHMLAKEQVLRGRSKLLITKDFMQTAVNAFYILLYGNLTDVAMLPPEYVLRSARTISMMKITREKLAAIWFVVKGGRPTKELSHEFLELYRPLFKYVNAKEMTRLNLLDTRILSYIGTHPDLSRHQIGVVASRYMRINPKWFLPKYLNLMNNILCGVPISSMKQISDDTYLQLSHQVFIHIWACEPLQRRFFLARMTRTQALGKPFSWSAFDISRLGLLLAEVSGKHLRSINPEAMSGITSQVMMEMLPQNLVYLTTAQTHYLDQKPLNILARKLKFHRDKMLMYGSGTNLCIPNIHKWTMVTMFLIRKSWNK